MKKKNDDLKYNENDERSILEDILDFVKVFAITALGFLVFVNFIAYPVNVVGRSMNPTLADGEYGFTNVLNATIKTPQRGDIVVVTMQTEDNTKSHWVKRIIGLPGETVSCKDDEIYINGEKLDESAYIDEDYKQEMIETYGYFNKVIKDYTDEEGVTVVKAVDFTEITLGDDEYFVCGDNRPYSKDSRNEAVGPVKRSQIFGNGILIFYPLNKMGIY